jgi:protein gp37
MNSIGWCDLTINPITGCRNGCKYCYAERFAKRLAGRAGYPAEDPFQPTFHPDKLEKIRKLRGEGKRVFLSSMGDWFSEGVEAEWVHKVLDAVDAVPQHHFLVLTKKPERILDTLHCRDLPPNLWLGVSVTCRADLWRISALKDSIPQATKRFVSFEPVLGPIYLPGQKLGGVDWAIIGAQTGPGKAEPKAQWVSDICWAADVTNIPVFLKKNLLHIVGGPLNFPPRNAPLRQEFPEVLL